MTTFIYSKEHALSSEICKEVIDLFESTPEFHSPGRTGGPDGKPAVIEEIKRSTDISLDPSFIYHPTWGGCINSLLTTLHDCVLEYKDKYKFIDKIGAWKLDSDINIQRYLPGEGYYQWHCESAGLDTTHRLLAWMIYLNDVEEGGGTEFNYDLPNLKAVEGSVHIWPSYWTHHHRGIIAPNETKYIITGWYVFDPNTKD
jgi:hypothetical protein